MASVQPAAVAATASHPYTCNTCQVAYRNIDLQKAHMKSDWHRYNLKRRVASLPPISSEIFTEKVLQARAVTTAEADKAYFERSCEACNKTYYSENAYRNHILSQKHKANETSAAQIPDMETNSVISSTFSLGKPTAVARPDVDSDIDEDFQQVTEHLQKSQISQPQEPVSEPAPAVTNGSESKESGSATPVPSATEPSWSLQSCLFCNYDSPTLPLNVRHMERFHGMFIPETPYIADLEGLVTYLNRKVREHHACLFCHKVKANLFATQTHMRDTGHCKVPYDTEVDQLEIGDYYDFRSTYSDGGESDDESAEEESGGAKLGAKLGAKPRKKAGRGEDDEDTSTAEEDGWETDSSASSLDSADLTAVPAESHLHQFERLSKHPHHSRHDPRTRHQVDGWHSHAHKHTHAAFFDDYEMHLPSGKSVGHRSLNKYFRQNLHNYPTEEERLERQAIEGAESEEDGENGDRTVTVHRDHRRGRDIVPRGMAGLAGASDEQKKTARKAEQRGRTYADESAKRKDYAYGKKLNNQKTYYYRYQNGG